MKNWKFIKTGNSDKEFKSEQELRRWAIDHQYTYKPTHGGYYMLEDDSGKGREPIEAHVSQPVVNKTGNSLPHDYHNRYPSDPIYADMKSSAQLESIKKEPWRVYDIMGVGDSLARERVFEMIEEKYGIDYNDIYEAWMGHSWDKAVQKKSMEDAKRLAQKLGLKFGNKKTGNEKISYPPEKLKDVSWVTLQYIIIHPEKYDEKTVELAKKIYADHIGNKKTGNAAVGAEVVAREVVEGKEYIVEKTSLRNGQDVQFNLYYSMDGSGKRHAGVFKDKESAVSAGKKIVGNARPKEQLLADVRELTKYIQEHPGQSCEKEKRLLGEAKEELDKEYGILVNNLKRARNSIKTKNSDVTLWNGNDTAYIKEDGHVQFLENNAFLVEEDKYDSQEQAVEDLTKKGYRKK